MMSNSMIIGRLLAFFLMTVLAAGHALADKPAWAGEKGGKNRGGEQREDRGDNASRDNEHHEGEYFQEHHRSAIREYFDGRSQSGHCPPGLAKKNNGCLPPGQAKKWDIGRPLPQDTVIYEVPRKLVVTLGQPPEGHRYVRVAGDILLIANATAVVVDAIKDLGR